MKNDKPPNYPKKKKVKVSSFVLEHQDTLLSSVISNLPHKNRKILKAVLKDGQVSVDKEVVRQFDHPLMPGQRVEVKWDRDLKGKHLCKLDIIHIDQDIVVINKPSGLLTIATDKEKRKTAYSILSNFVKTEHPENKIFIIHRIDRETSGLLMFARSEKVKQQIQKTWNATISERTYIGVVEGKVTSPEGTITSWLTESKAFIVYSSRNEGTAGKRAVTHSRKVMWNASVTMLQINLETGRKHQIRVHMQDLGHPLIGDKKYGSHLNPIKRMGLHAQGLAFTHPATGELCRFAPGLPREFLKLLAPETQHRPAERS